MKMMYSSRISRKKKRYLKMRSRRFFDRCTHFARSEQMQLSSELTKRIVNTLKSMMACVPILLTQNIDSKPRMSNFGLQAPVVSRLSQMSIVLSAGIGSKAATCIRALKKMAAWAGMIKLNIGMIMTSCCDSIRDQSEFKEPARKTLITKLPVQIDVADDVITLVIYSSVSAVDASIYGGISVSTLRSIFIGTPYLLMKASLFLNSTIILSRSTL